MKYSLLTLLIIITVSTGNLAAQEAGKTRGTVLEKSEHGHPQSLPGASLYWVGLESKGVATDMNGAFEIINPSSFPAKLVVSFVGKPNDTIAIATVPTDDLSIVLSNNSELKEVVIKGKIDATSTSLYSDINKEVITTKELKKAACCSLSDSFETTATVDLKFDDAVTGTKKIQMLGLDGVYAQILNENIPMIGGLSSNIGLGSIPGTWIESISVTKGAGSVVNSYESITGQINIDLIKSDKADQAFYNVYANSKGNMQLNVHLANKFGEKEKWSSILFMHVGDLSFSHDINKDSILDMPLSRKYSIFNRWKYSGENYHSQYGVKYLNDSRTGGQIGFSAPEPADTTQPLYGIGIDVQEVEIFTKNGFIFPKHPFQSIGIQFSAKHHEQKSFYGYGLKTYSGVENRIYTNVIYQIESKNSVTKFKAGTSFIYDDFDEHYMDTTFLREEIVPGVFTEFTYNKKKITAVTGLRADYHNLYGMFFTPRVHLKYRFKEKSAIRISGGTGLRTANVLIENARALASSRTMVFQEALLPEEAINFGTSITHKFDFLKRSSSVNVDYYNTIFTNQVIADYDTDVTKVLIYNLDGKSNSQSFQIDFDFEPIERLEVKMSYKHYDVKITYGDKLLSRPLIPTDRALINVSYESKNEKWLYNLTNQYFGKSRIPNTSALSEELRLPTESSEYFMFNAQVTRIFKNTEWYVGAENITNYKQPNPIIDPSNPFGSSFDASLIWGPLAGRIIFVGMRLNIK